MHQESRDRTKSLAKILSASLLIAIFILAGLIFHSCSNKYMDINTDNLNIILKMNGPLKPERIMELYNELYGISKGIITVTKYDRWTKVRIEQVSMPQSDDSEAASKVIIEAELTSHVWQAKSIQRSWKCYAGRGHQYWSAKKCN